MAAPRIWTHRRFGSIHIRRRWEDLTPEEKLQEIVGGLLSVGKPKRKKKSSVFDLFLTLLWVVYAAAVLLFWFLAALMIGMVRLLSRFKKKKPNQTPEPTAAAGRGSS